MHEVLLVMIMTALACAVLGPFLVLRELSMTADALSHSVFLGIVVAFIFVHDLGSVWLTVGATIFGLLTVFFVEVLAKNKLAKEKDALGIIFPIFFSIAVIIITKFFRNSHLDVDLVIMGNPLFAPFVRAFGLPRSFLIMLLVFILNLLFIIIFYKPLKVVTFDRDYAQMQGIKITPLFYGLMLLTSLTCVGAFDSVGGILVISFFVAPATCAYLITKNLSMTIILSMFFGTLMSVFGFYVGFAWNVSVAGMSAFGGLILVSIIVIFNPNGYIKKLFDKYRNRKQLSEDLVLIHIYRHNDNIKELGADTIHNHLNWSYKKANNYLMKLTKENFISINENKFIYQLTDKGWERVKILLGN